MALKIFHLKLMKGIRLKRFLLGNGRNKPRKSVNGTRSSSTWMIPVSHGYHHVQNVEFDHVGKEFDPVLVQREQIKECKLWFFGIFDERVGEGVTKYMQSHFFGKITKESQLRKQSKQAMKRAHLSARAKVGGKTQSKDAVAPDVGSATAMVIGGEKLVVVNMGDYGAVVCRDGEAYQICKKKDHPITRHWSLSLIPGLSRTASEGKISKSSEIVVGSEKIDSATEFVILASTGVWEVMKHQEAVNLIRHIEDPQQAAECLATEALTRMSRSNITCLIIRFD